MPSITDQELHLADHWGVPPILVRVNESFDQLVALNPDLRIEQAASGEVVFMSPTGGESGRRNSRLITQLVLWSDSHGGRIFDSSTLFQLPNGAKRSPDVAWVSQGRWEKLTLAEREGFPPLCPDLVVELRSKSDRLIDLQEKMDEYQANGAQLGWLIDPLFRQVHIYRRGHQPEILIAPSTLAGGEFLLDLVVDLSRIWSDI